MKKRATPGLEYFASPITNRWLTKHSIIIISSFYRMEAIAELHLRTQTRWTGKISASEFMS